MAADSTRPAYWTDPGKNEPVVDWVLRMQVLYRIEQVRARLDATDKPAMEAVRRG